jgi:hypothetical protein
MDKCPKCNANLIIGNVNSEFRNDDTPEGSTELWLHKPQLCLNPKCDNYCGLDTMNPKTVVHTESNLEYKKVM